MIEIITLNGIQYEKTEDDKKVYLKEISDRENKVHMTFSKDKKDNEEAMYGLRVFFTELFSK